MMPAFSCIPFKLIEKCFYFDTLVTLVYSFQLLAFSCSSNQSTTNWKHLLFISPKPCPALFFTVTGVHLSFQHVWTIKMCECDSVPGFRIQITKTSSHIWNASRYTETEVQKISEAPGPCSSPDSVAPGLASQDLRGILDYPSWL